MLSRVLVETARNRFEVSTPRANNSEQFLLTLQVRLCRFTEFLLTLHFYVTLSHL